MEEHKIWVNEKFYTYKQMVNKIETSEYDRLKFLETMSALIFTAHDLTRVHQLKIVDCTHQFIQARESFIMAFTDFYTNPNQDDFEIIFRWQTLASKVLLEFEKDDESKQKTRDGKEIHA